MLRQGHVILNHDLFIVTWAIYRLPIVWSIVWFRTALCSSAQLRKDEASALTRGRAWSVSFMCVWLSCPITVVHQVERPCSWITLGCALRLVSHQVWCVWAVLRACVRVCPCACEASRVVSVSWLMEACARFHHTISPEFDKRRVNFEGWSSAQVCDIRSGKFSCIIKIREFTIIHAHKFVNTSVLTYKSDQCAKVQFWSVGGCEASGC
jgi:hypothetical protein